MDEKERKKWCIWRFDCLYQHTTFLVPAILTFIIRLVHAYMYVSLSLFLPRFFLFLPTQYYANEQRCECVHLQASSGGCQYWSEYSLFLSSTLFFSWGYFCISLCLWQPIARGSLFLSSCRSFSEPWMTNRYRVPPSSFVEEQRESPSHPTKVSVVKPISCVELKGSRQSLQKREKITAFW